MVDSHLLLPVRANLSYCWRAMTRPRRHGVVRAVGAAASLGFATLVTPPSVAAPVAPPPGFIVDMLSTGWNEAVGGLVLPDGHFMHWERGGQVWVHHDDGAHKVIDIAHEVGGWRDHGLLGVALHPAFESNGLIYLYYVVDREHLINGNSPEYNPNADWYYEASIARITRYRLTPESKFTELDPTSRTVLVGESITTGFPICHQSHAVGSLAFGDDGTLLATFGDSASYESVDEGGQVSGGYVTTALADGILRARENVGAFRAQSVDSLCGKVLRLDPETGDGVPSNPWFDAANPRAPRSRVWCLGLRNPFRMTFVAESGSHDPADGDPGTILIGDVGWYTYEELNVADGPGLNFGWPVFEGHKHMGSYAGLQVLNLGASNPLGGGSCPSTLEFKDLIAQDTTQLPVAFANPCALKQAESAQWSGPVFATVYKGYTGSGYVDFGSTTGEWVEWQVTVPTAGAWTIGIRYANGGSQDRPCAVLVDGATVNESLNFARTGSFTEWRWLPQAVTMGAGLHTVRVRSTINNGPNIDAITLYQGASPELIPSTVPTFVHRRPALDWNHGADEARTPTFNSFGAASATPLGAPGGAAGSSFAGACAIGGAQLEAEGFPAEWRGKRLIGDFAHGWIRAVTVDPLTAPGGGIIAVEPFDTTFGAVVALVAHPTEPMVYAIRWGSEIARIHWLPGGSAPPTARIESTHPWGPSPLAVTFDGSTSTDPEQGALQYQWDFGAGGSATGAVASHTFTSASGAPARFDVRLTVTDNAGLSHQALLVVSPNNSPPVADIISLYDGMEYQLGSADIVYPLVAAISDAEHGDGSGGGGSAGGVSCGWTVILHHNSHEHAEPAITQCTGGEAVVTPLGCGAESYWWEVRLVATDAHGLSGTDAVALLPDCDGSSACVGDFDGDGTVGGGDLAAMLGAWGPTAGSAIDLDHDGIIGGADLALLLTAWGGC